MNHAQLTATLKELPIKKLSYFPSIGSTNDLAGKWAESDAPDLSLVVADEQTKGRGRSGNKWFTYPGSALAFSLLIRPDNNFTNLNTTLYTGLGAVAVCETLNKEFNLQSKIKWPNDILIEGKKVCGILAESHWHGDKIIGVVIGIGINITRDSIPPSSDLTLNATFAENYLSSKIDRNILLRNILKRIIYWKDQISSKEFLSIWNQNLAYKNDPIQLITSNNVIKNARIINLSSDGALNVRYEDNSEEKILAGEIHLRPIVDS